MEVAGIDAQIAALVNKKNHVSREREQLLQQIKDLQKAPSLDWKQAFPWSPKVEEARKKVFKIDKFRENQLEVINVCMSKRDCFVIMPTGGGKSLCYQIPALVSTPALLFQSPGLVTVAKKFVWTDTWGPHARDFPSGVPDGRPGDGSGKPWAQRQDVYSRHTKGGDQGHLCRNAQPQRRAYCESLPLSLCCPMSSRTPDLSKLGPLCDSGKDFQVEDAPQQARKGVPGRSLCADSHRRGPLLQPVGARLPPRLQCPGNSPGPVSGHENLGLDGNRDQEGSRGRNVYPADRELRALSEFLQQTQPGV